MAAYLARLRAASSFATNARISVSDLPEMRRGIQP